MLILLFYTKKGFATITWYIMKQPFFSIVIPTYNRADLLKCAISSFLAQNFGDFEIIVSDNNSTDNTRKVIESFQDKRITYSKNNENTGVMPNVKKLILMARGKYIITQGDDDVILFPNSLRRIYEFINKKNYGFIRLNYLSLDRGNIKITNVWINEPNDMHITNEIESLSIINFLEKLHIDFLSGLVFKNENIAPDDFIYSEISPWVKILFRLSKKYGAGFMSDNYIISSWSEGDISKIYIIDKDNRLYFENYYNCVTKELLDKNEAVKYRRFFFERFRKGYIYFFPALKYLTNNKNLKAYKDRLCFLNKNFNNDFMFWFYYFLSLCMPRFIISFLRKHHQFIRSDNIRDIKNIKAIDDIKKRYQSLREIIGVK